MTAPGMKAHDNWDMKRYICIFSVLVFCMAVSIVLSLLESARGSHYLVSNPFIWHNFVEFMSTIVAFSIFLIAFYTYYQNMNLRLAISGFTFLVTGVLDWMHIITNVTSDNGSNVTNSSISFLMLARLVNAIGFFLMVVVPEHKKNSIRRSLILSLSASFILLSYLLLAENSRINSLIIGQKGFKAVGAIILAVIAILYAYNVYRSIKDYRKNQDLLNITLACSFIIMFFSQLIALEMTSVADLRGILSHIFKFAAFILFFNIFYIHNIRRPYILLSKAKEELNSYTYELDQLVDKRTNELRQVNKRLMTDLEVAKGIQKSMLPTVFPQNDFVSFTAGYLPAEHLSGDFYNVIKIDDTRYGITIGDVSGHGVSAAMLTVFTFQKIQSLMEETGQSGMSIPSVVLKHLYDSFNSANFSEELYIVLLYGVYNIDTGIFSYASGGLNTAPLRLRPDGSIQELDTDGYAICKLGQLLKPKFVNHQVMLFPGDKLLLYTDGLVETVDDNGNQYSKERLKDLISKNRKWNANHLSNIIVEDVRQYSKAIKDDITLLILDVLRPF